MRLPDWFGWFVVGAATVALLLLACWCDDQAKRDCERKGGQFVHVYKSTLCVKPGSVIE